MSRIVPGLPLSGSPASQPHDPGRGRELAGSGESAYPLRRPRHGRTHRPRRGRTSGSRSAGHRSMRTGSTGQTDHPIVGGAYHTGRRVCNDGRLPAEWVLAIRGAVISVSGWIADLSPATDVDLAEHRTAVAVSGSEFTVPRRSISGHLPAMFTWAEEGLTMSFYPHQETCYNWPELGGSSMCRP